MKTKPKHISAPPRDIKPTRPAIGDQLFHMSLATILQAYLYGHINEAGAMRTIAGEIRRCLT